MQSRPKVIFVTPLWDKPRTGPEVYAKYLWESFRDDPGIEFHLVAAGEGDLHPRMHLVRATGGSLSLYKTVARRALELMRELGPHGILHVNNSNFHQSLLGSNWPIIGQINDYEAAQFRHNVLSVLRQFGPRRVLALWRRNVLERKFVHKQAVTLCNSEFTRSQIRLAYGAEGKDIRIAYKAVDVGRFIPPIQETRSTHSGGQKTVIFVGTNFRLKGLDVLIKAMACLEHSAKLVVIGVGSSEFEQAFPGIANHAERMGRPIHFLGSVERDKIPALLWSADVFCLPSRVEALGVALLEGVAAGLRCVATNVGGIPEIARHFDSVSLVPPDDPGALAAAIDKTFTAPPPAPCGDKIRGLFSREKMTQEIKTIYQELTR